jgi:hypothetical protein
MVPEMLPPEAARSGNGATDKSARSIRGSIAGITNSTFMLPKWNSVRKIMLRRLGNAGFGT